MYDLHACSNDFTAYLNALTQKSMLCFASCGSVDDGKSTLIGRLLYEAGMISDDQLLSLQKDSRKSMAGGEGLDFSLLVDGLSAEREQGITIDVAYRFFSTAKRSFMVADTPGHEQYTRNMATAASQVELALVIVDARKGLLTQTRRHSYILSLFGVKQFILAVNKMDLMGYDEAVFRAIEADFREFAAVLGLNAFTVIPVSALEGDNVVSWSKRMPWYQGAALLPCLETVSIVDERQKQAFRMPVQWVNRAHADFRGYAGQVIAGTIKKNDIIKILPSGKESRVKDIILHHQQLESAEKGQSVTLTLTDDLDISRGDLLVDASQPAEIASQFDVYLLWFNEKPLVSGRQYLLKSASCSVFASVVAIRHCLNVDRMQPEASNELRQNEIARCEIALEGQMAFDPFEQCPESGSFILIDRITNETLAAGLIQSALSRASHLFSQKTLVEKTMRAVLKHQTPLVLWFTGLSGSGKSSIANRVEKTLNQMGMHTMLLDGDNIRQGLNRDLGFSESDRAENIRRVAEVARLMTEAGLITLVSLISPFAADREMARHLIGEDAFLEIFVDAPLDVIEARDPKGLYQKSRKGEIKQFTGIDSPYEKPVSPDLIIDTSQHDEEHSARLLIEFLRMKKWV